MNSMMGILMGGKGGWDGVEMDWNCRLKFNLRFKSAKFET